jgi:two-component system nitrogen regulation response regulator GlnG
MDELVGRSAVARGLRRRVLEAAGWKRGVCIEGPPGTALVSLGVAIHSWSERRSAPCLVLPASTYQELERAGQSLLHPVRRDQVEGGTCPLVGDWTSSPGTPTWILLEAASLPRGTVADLAREEGRILLVQGPAEEREVFREAARLAGCLVLTAPSLRERREDLAALLDRLASKRGCPLLRQSLTPAAQAVLLDQDLPGNLRELRLVVEELAREDSRRIDTERLEAALSRVRRSCENGTEANGGRRIRDRRWAPSLRSRIREVERAEILAALEGTSWNRQRAAA